MRSPACCHQTSSQGLEILRSTVVAELEEPAPFLSMELRLLGRWILCHTADSFSSPTWVVEGEGEGVS